jgi:CelD/BcsL family acetyltransferase involved in cellulose biosynthesis
MTNEASKIETSAHREIAGFFANDAGSDQKRVHGAARTDAFSSHAPCSTTVEKITTMEQLEALRQPWDDLLRHTDSTNMFLTWEWAFAWWKHLRDGRQLYVLAVRRESRLIALAPLALEKAKLRRLRPFRSIEFIGMGTVSTDYPDMIIRSGSETSALEALSDYISQHAIMFEFNGLHNNSTPTSKLASILESSGWLVSRVITDVCPGLQLDNLSWDTYVSSLGPSHRANLRRRIRYLERHFTLVFQHAETESQRLEYMKVFVSLHHKRWDTRYGSNALKNDSLLRFHEEFSQLALQRGWLRLFLLQLDGRPVAAIYGFRYGDTFYYYQSGFDPDYATRSVGLVALGLSIRNAINNGVLEYDLLRGAEAYKFLWSNTTRELMTLQCYPPVFRGTLSWVMERARRNARTFGVQLGTSWRQNSA